MTTTVKYRLKHAGWWSLAIIIYYVWFQAFYDLIAYHKIIPNGSTASLVAGFGYNFLATVLLFLLNLFVVYFSLRQRSLAPKIALDAVASFTMLGIMAFVHHRVMGKPADWAGIVMENVLVFLIVEVVYLFQHYKDSVIETQRARQQSLQYQYDALKAQVNPHFLFNSLNILNSLVSIDQQKSKEFIEQLSMMYRYVMAQQNCERVSLAEELDFLDSYVSVLAMRYHNKFKLEITGREQVSDQQIIPFTMQLLIENVTKHNVISARQPMTVTITIGPDGVVVQNPIRPRTAEASTHIGLRYLTELYAVQRRTFAIHNDGTTFTATVPFI